MSTPLPTVGTAKRIDTLEQAATLDGTELVPIVQNGTTRHVSSDRLSAFTRPYTTFNRPLLTIANVGYGVFDVTIGKPIWWTGSQWVDANGASA